MQHRPVVYTGAKQAPSQQDRSKRTLISLLVPIEDQPKSPPSIPAPMAHPGQLGQSAEEWGRALGMGEVRRRAQSSTRRGSFWGRVLWW